MIEKSQHRGIRATEDERLAGDVGEATVDGGTLEEKLDVSIRNGYERRESFPNTRDLRLGVGPERIFGFGDLVLVEDAIEERDRLLDGCGP